MNPAPTPRTDKEAFEWRGLQVVRRPEAPFVRADFARTLERELTSAQAALAAKDAEIARLAKERDEWHSAHSIRSDELDGAVGMLNEAKARAEKAEAEVAQIAQILPKRGHDTIGAARDVMQDLAENRAELAAAKADTERLDWLEAHAATFAQIHVSRYPFAAPNQDKRWMAKIEYWEFYADTWRDAVDQLRAAIDAARNNNSAKQ